MIFDQNKHHRRSVRLASFDYSQHGAYFATLCAWNRECLFGEIVDGAVRLNENGRIVTDEWRRSTAIRQEIELDEFIVMPNHVHGIVIIHANNINNNVRANGHSPLQTRNEPIVRMKPKSLSSFMAGFKSAVTKRINEMRKAPRMPVWQRNYYEHIVRNEEDLNRIREYIRNNPMQWEIDENNPHRIKKQ